ncbi:MAG TPA: bifunctional molybdenum cofactor biosynthesis protein MoaC/MoaB [Nitrososphaeraceae archaeon]|nr:bifunctional molybdenum cofactor biosynthesis protein MoaC/MoaB [Nitrososphaeraceae archaeon]
MNETDTYYKGMFDVSKKGDTLRIATAQAIIKVNPESIDLIKNGKTPKGDIIEAAKISATLGAKKTWELIPYCHPIPIDHISTQLLLYHSSIEIKVSVKSVWKTGVEMEALTGCSVAALAIYDMLKPIDEYLSIESIKLLDKTGGKRDFIESLDKKINVAIFVISDSTFNGTRVDKSGKIIIDRLKNTYTTNTEIVGYEILPDNIDKIKASLIKYSDEKKVDLIITSGGTGFSKRDVTPEATKMIIDKEANGISETIRSYGQRRTPLSMLSRGISGTRDKTLIVNLPGSTKAVSESLDLLLPSIFHVFNMLEGKGH